MNCGRYRIRMRNVYTAWQVTDNTVDLLADMSGGQPVDVAAVPVENEHPAPTVNAVLLPSGDIARPGDWLIRTDDGYLTVSDHVFHHLYERAV